MNMYNLIEYSDNYSDSTASWYHYKRQVPLENSAVLTDYWGIQPMYLQVKILYSTST